MLKSKQEQVQLILVKYFKASVCKIVLPQHIINVKIIIEPKLFYTVFEIHCAFYIYSTFS